MTIDEVIQDSFQEGAPFSLLLGSVRVVVPVTAVSVWGLLDFEQSPNQENQDNRDEK